MNKKCLISVMKAKPFITFHYDRAISLIAVVDMAN